MVVDNDNWRKNEGNRLHGYPDKKTTNQIWVPSKNPNGSISFRNPHSGKCIGAKDGVKISAIYGIYTCSNSDVNQQFKFTQPAASIEAPSNYVNIVGPEGLCVDSPPSKGRGLTQSTCSASNTHQWQFIPHNNGYVIKSKSGLVFDNKGWKTHDGNSIDGYDDKKTTNQIWVLERGENGSIVFRNPHSKKCMDNRGSSGLGKGFGLMVCNVNDENQQFKLQTPNDWLELPNGYGNLVSGEGKCVESRDKRGHELLSNNCGNSDKMAWQFIPHDNGYVIKSKNGFVFDNKAWKTHEGNSIDAYDDKKTTNQIWVPELSKDRSAILLRNPISNKCVGTRGSSKFGLYTCNISNHSQYFKLAGMIFKNSTVEIPTGVYNINTINGNCISASNSSFQKLISLQCSPVDLMKWEFIPYNGGYIIKSKSGLVFDNSNSLNVENNPIVGNTMSKNNNQIWIPMKLENGSMIFKNPESNKCLGLVANMLNLITCNNLDQNQMFKIVRAPVLVQPRPLPVPVAPVEPGPVLVQPRPLPVPVAPAPVLVQPRPLPVPVAPVVPAQPTNYINYYNLPSGAIDPSTLGPIQPFSPVAGNYDINTLRN
jgi:hypothetical protein